ncbi:MAG: GNAT family N-acetyltransferase [Anaerolineales bacterium]|nr:GNAT family N-acetyltransferase [Anaerolineales bacterium]
MQNPISHWQQERMIELNTNDFLTVSPLFKGIEHNESLVFSVIEGNSPGRVFVDRLDAPASVYLLHEGAFHFVGGSAVNDCFNQALVSLIFDDVLSSSEEQELVLFAFSEIWRETLDALLSHHGAIRIRRKTFAFNPTGFQACGDWRGQIPEGFHIRHVDKKLAEKHVVYRPLIEAGSQRFGTCLMKGDEIISVCQAVCVGGGKAEIDIHTEEIHQRQGYAFLTACAFIEECLQRNLTPSWSCWPEREASCVLAKKLGFEEMPDIPAHYWMADM